MRSESKVVVIGGGVAGCSVLYHLTKLGWTDVTLVEENELTSGSTWHAAGLCTQMISSWNLMKVLQYSLKLYNSLHFHPQKLRNSNERGFPCPRFTFPAATGSPQKAKAASRSMPAP